MVRNPKRGEIALNMRFLDFTSSTKGVRRRLSAKISNLFHLPGRWRWRGRGFEKLLHRFAFLHARWQSPSGVFYFCATWWKQATCDFRFAKAAKDREFNFAEKSLWFWPETRLFLRGFSTSKIHDLYYHKNSWPLLFFTPLEPPRRISERWFWVRKMPCAEDRSCYSAQTPPPHFLPSENFDRRHLATTVFPRLNTICEKGRSLLCFYMGKQCKYNRRWYKVIAPTSNLPEDSQGEYFLIENTL